MSNTGVPHTLLRGGGGMEPLTIVAGVISSIGLHGIILMLVILGTRHTEQKIEAHVDEKMLVFERVDLLALGEEKPPDALPRISNPAPLQVKPKTVDLSPKEPAVALKKPKEEEPPPQAEEVDQKEERRKKALEALSALHDPERPTNDELPEGSEDGVVGGLSDAARANLMGTFQAKLVAELSQSWTLPSTLTPQEVRELSGQVNVYVRLSEDGLIVSFQFRKRSGNEQFDDSIERLLRRFEVSGGGKRLPMPENEEVRALVVKHGLNLNDWEFTGR